MTLNEFSRELDLARHINGTNDLFGVEYYSASNTSNRNFVMFKTEQEFNSFKGFYKDYDFIFNKLAI